VAHPSALQGRGDALSEPGFNHLLHLRLAWANERFECLFVGNGLKWLKAVFVYEHTYHSVM
jgi:hypothetical protein